MRHSAMEDFEALSPRERQIFTLIVLGKSSGDIASSLGLAVKTIDTHRLHINTKLGTEGPADIVRFAVREGFLTRMKTVGRGGEAWGLCLEVPEKKPTEKGQKS